MSRQKDRREVLRATIAVAASRLLGFPLALAISMWLTRVLPRDEFTFFGVLATFSIVFAIFAQAGFQTGVVRMLGEADAGDERHSAPAVVYAAVASTIVCSLLLAGLFYFAGRGFLPDIPGQTDWLFALAALLLVVRAVNTVAAEALRGIGRVGLSSNFSGQGNQGGMVRCLLVLAGFGVAAALDILTLETAIWASIAASVVCALWALAIVLRHTGAKASLRAIASTIRERRHDNFNMVLSEGLIFWTSGSAALVIGGILIDATLMAGMVAAFQLRNILTSPLTVIAGAVPNILIRLHREGEKDELERVMRTTGSAAFLLCVGVCGALALIGPAGFRLLFGAEYGDAYFHFLIMAVGITYFVYCGLSGQALLLMGDTRVHRRVMTKVLAVTMPAYVALAYFFGPYGLSVALAGSMILQKHLLIRAIRQDLDLDTRAYLDPREYRKAFTMLKRILAEKTGRKA